MRNSSCSLAIDSVFLTTYIPLRSRPIPLPTSKAQSNSPPSSPGAHAAEPPGKPLAHIRPARPELAATAVAAVAEEAAAGRTTALAVAAAAVVKLAGTKAAFAVQAAAGRIAAAVVAGDRVEVVEPAAVADEAAGGTSRGLEDLAGVRM